jgi:hypothetical protein
MTDEEGYSVRRLWNAVEAILDAGAVPFSERADLGEEIAGHIRERMQAHVDGGFGVNAATERAIEEFGAPAAIGRDLRETYHSRLWVSTIGVLLPVPAADTVPGVVLWLARGGKFIAILSVLMAAYAAATMPPIRSLVVGVSLAVGGVVIWIAAEALRRGQSWGWNALGWVMVVETFVLFSSLSTPTGVNLSINGLVGFLLLMRLVVGNQILRAWTASSGTLSQQLAAGVCGVLFLWTLAPYAADRLPDPTQASAGDIHVVASVDCNHKLDWAPTEKAIAVVLDVTWARVDLLPFGISRAEDWGDSVQVDFEPPFWETIGPSLIDPSTGSDLDQNGAYGTTMPATFGPAMAGIDASVMHEGRPVRLTLASYPQDTETMDSPTSVVIRYAHRDAFVLKTELACGGRGTLVPEATYDSWTGRDLMTGLPLQQ